LFYSCLFCFLSYLFSFNLILFVWFLFVLFHSYLFSFNLILFVLFLFVLFPFLFVLL
jgi:hypothetical protein